jgi:hypothetical protein
MSRLDTSVGPGDILARVAGRPAGTPISSPEDEAG